MTAFSELAKLNARRKRLGMSFAALAKRSGVSMPTVVRILGGKNPDASFANVAAIAQALGLGVCIEEQIDEEELREQQARAKAEFLVRIVQGTSGLEGQAVDERVIERMVKRTERELLANDSGRKLWGE